MQGLTAMATLCRMVVQEGDTARSAPITSLAAAGEFVGVAPGRLADEVGTDHGDGQEGGPLISLCDIGVAGALECSA